MKNFVKPGKCIKYTNATGADIPSGQAIVIGDVVVVATGIIKNGEEGEVLTEGVVRLAKVAGQAFALGAKLYWDPAAKNLTTTAGALKVIGFCAEAELAASTSAEVKLCPGL